MNRYLGRPCRRTLALLALLLIASASQGQETDSRFQLLQREGEPVIHDSETGLFWEVKSATDEILNKERIFSLPEAKEYTRLELEGYAGLSEWRLPTIQELFGILNYETFQPAVGSAFHDPEKDTWCQPAMYWSSTRPAADLTRACYVDFFDGTVLQDNAMLKLYVRAVHDPVPATTPATANQETPEDPVQADAEETPQETINEKD